MFRLPVCPHCKTVYSYKDVKENHKEKVIKCYHCNKEFRNNKTGIIVLALIICVIAAIVNVFVLNTASDVFVTIIPIIVISVAAVVIGMLLVPFFISYKK